MNPDATPKSSQASALTLTPMTEIPENEVLRRMRSVNLLRPNEIHHMAYISYDRIEAKVLSAYDDPLPMTPEAAIVLSDHLRELAETLQQRKDV